jgi:hypothetical protein
MFDEKQINICEEWEKTVHQTVTAAAECERLAAIEDDDVKDGISVIEVLLAGLNDLTKANPF